MPVGALRRLIDMKAGFAVVGFVVVALLFATGCGSIGGTIQGIAVPCLGAGGRANPLAHPTVEISKGKNEVESFEVLKPWYFQVNLPAGVYTVTMVDNPGLTVTVRDGQTAQAILGSDCG